MKNNKSFSKRMRVSKNGKVVSRAPGQNHFNAKRSGASTMRHKRAGSFHAAMDNTAKSRFFTH